MMMRKVTLVIVMMSTVMQSAESGSYCHWKDGDQDLVCSLEGSSVEIIDRQKVCYNYKKYALFEKLRN